MKKILIGAFAFLLGSSSYAQSIFSDKPLDMDTALHYGILENGLTYYIRHNDVVPNRADFYIVQNVGAILEEDNQNGLAHFLEHMAFNGTANFPGKMIIDYMESIGVNFGGDINAYTSLDETVYNLKSVPTVRESIVDTALMVLHDWSGFISLQGEEIDKERGVIREEWRTRMNASRRLWKASLPILYPNSQYAKRDVIGDTAIINNFAHDTLRAYYHRWYRPDLQAIIVVGDVDVKKTEAKIKDFWKDIPKRINPDERRIYPVQPNKEPIIAVLTDKEAKTSSIQVAYRHDPMPDMVKASRYGYFMMIVQQLVENMFSDRLDEIAAKRESPFAAGYTGYGEEVRSVDAFTTIAVPHEGKEEASLIAVLTEIERMKRFGFTLTELDRAKVNLLSSYEKAYNERAKVKNDSYVKEYISNYLDFLPVPGIEWEYQEVQNILPNIKLDLVNQVAKYFVGEQPNQDGVIIDRNQVVLMKGPEKEGVSFPSKERTLEIIEQVKNSELEPYKEDLLDSNLIDGKLKAKKVKKVQSNPDIPGVTEWILGNGMRVVLQPTQLMDDQILLQGFSEGGLSKVTNMEDVPSARLCVGVLQKNGMGKFNEVNLYKALAGKTVALRPSVDLYEESFSGSSSVKDFETLLQLVYLTFTGARKDDEGFEVMMNQYSTYLTNKANDPSQTFRDSVSVTVNAHHPRMEPIDINMLSKVSQETALRVFKERFADPKDFTVCLVGNINPDSCKMLIEKYLGGIPVQKRMKVERWSDMGIRVPKGQMETQFDQVMSVDKNSNFVLFSGVCDYTLKNRLVYRMLADILDIRYLESMREDEGGTYGVGVSATVAKIPFGRVALQMSFDTDPKLEEKLMELIHVEIEKIMKEGPLDVDFNKVKENLRNKFEDAQKRNNAMMSFLEVYYKDGFVYHRDYLPTLDAITKEDVRDALKVLVAQGNEIKVVMRSKKE